MSSLAALFVLPLALVAGTVALVLLRARALRRALPIAFDPESPLAPGALLRLRRWERRLRLVVALVVTTYLVSVALALTAAPASTDARAAGASLALLVLGLLSAIGASIQFSELCPRCGYNLGFQSRLLHLEACERCGGRWR